MTTINPSVLFQKTPAKHSPASNAINHFPVSQVVQGPRFSGDAFEIRQKLKGAEALKTQQAANQKKEVDFKAACDTVVWQQGDDTLTVGEMVAYLCRIREDEDYPGYGTVETLAKDFPGMDIEALRQGFEKLHNNAEDPCYLGRNYGQEKFYWLRPDGAEMIERLYPDITLPYKGERFTEGLSLTMI